MGIMLWVAGFVVLAVLYIPGFLLVRGCGASRVAAALCAPMVMVGLYVLIGMGLRQAAVFATGPVMLGCGLALAAVVYGIGRMARRGSRRNSFQAAALPCEETASEVIGRAEGSGRRLVRTLRRGGDWSLLAVAQAFLQSGVWSPFAANLYSAPDAAAFNPLPLGGFYPTAWSMLAAFAASLTGCSVPVAANALNCAIAAVVYPASLFFLVRILFPARRDIQAAGSVVMLASTQFPWALMIFGPLYPNMLAYALMPAVAACFICWLGPVRTFARQSASVADAACYPLARPTAHGRWFLLMLAGVVTCVFAQPNAVFSLGVFLVSYIVAKAYGHGQRQAIACSVAPIALASERSACSPFPEHSSRSSSPAGRSEGRLLPHARASRASVRLRLLARPPLPPPGGRGALPVGVGRW